ncbi:mechanosensitive ion channel [Leptolyngbya sp. 15MV]|nr:mechanosensitive ion channel [Leptolyngbya sp. 15MV]
MQATRALFRQFGDPEVIEWVTEPLPAPGPGEVTIEHGAVGLNFIDTYHRRIGMTALLTVAAVAGGWLAHRIVFALSGRIAAMSIAQVDDLVLQRIRRPAFWAFIAIAITLAAQYDASLAAIWVPVAQILRPAILGWIAYSLVKAFTAALEFRLAAQDDPIVNRSRKTRIAILSRTATFAIVLITIGLMLLGIPGVRDIGVTVMASAGLAALAVGAAAQPALKSLIAGLQMALTEPLRIGDLVVVDGHTGRVEEIRMSFVIVRTWDERAVIVPTSRFLDQSFENWSRTNEMLTGPVFLHLNPATKVAPIRVEFLRFVGAHPLWDGRTASLLMTESRTETIELRLAMSARTIGDLFDLRCAVREHMIEWLRSEMPEALIRQRIEIEPAAGAKR